MATRKLYEIRQGEPLKLLVPLLLDGVATSITGWTVWLTVKRDAMQQDAVALAQLSLGSGISAYDANKWLAELPAAATKTATPGALIYVIEAKDPAGVPYTLEEGDILLLPEINQAA